VIDVNLKSESLGISFTPIWTSSRSRPNIAGIDLMVRNALRSSFRPPRRRCLLIFTRCSSRRCSERLTRWRCFSNVNAGRGNPSSLNNVFLAGSDDFAFGVSAEFVTSAFQPALDRILTTPVAPVKFNLDLLFTTIHVTYTLTLNSVTIQLRPLRSCSP
jgi:hypothetical protein